jgi:hypothetical protein
MLNAAQSKRTAGTVLLCLLMGFVLFIAGLLGGSYLWSPFGPPSSDPYDLASYRCGIVVRTVFAATGAAAFLRLTKRQSLEQSKP